MKVPVLFLALSLISVLSGCSKKEEPAPEAAVAAPAPVPEAAAPAENTPAAPVAPVGNVDVKSSFSQSDAALKKKDYETAADALIRLQVARVPMTEAQGFDRINRMRDLQKQIADAMMSGDPNAKRAAELLRRSAMIPAGAGR
jgi:hypothetical protein